MKKKKKLSLRIVHNALMLRNGSFGHGAIASDRCLEFFPWINQSDVFILNPLTTLEQWKASRYRLL